MILTDEDLKAISKILNNEVAGIQSEINEIKEDLAGFKVYVEKEFRLVSDSQVMMHSEVLERFRITDEVQLEMKNDIKVMEKRHLEIEKRHLEIEKGQLKMSDDIKEIEKGQLEIKKVQLKMSNDIKEIKKGQLEIEKVQLKMSNDIKEIEKLALDAWGQSTENRMLLNMVN
jgi:cell division protein FtsL